MRTALRAVVLGLLALVSTVLTSETASADGMICADRGDFGKCILWVQAPGSGGSQGSSGDGPTGEGPCGPRPCQSNFGVWSFEKMCYVRREEPQPPASDPVWGTHSDGTKTEGVIMRCLVSAQLSGEAYFFWVASGDPASAPDPRALALQAVEYMGLQAIRIGSFPWTVEKSPQSMGVVGWNVWLWVDGASSSTFGPITKSASAGGYTVTATGRVSKVVWDMGNGDVVTCGRGTPYPRYSSDRNPKSPDCGYAYARDGDYQVSATSYWDVSWSGIGQSGVIPMQLTSTGRITIAEVQVVSVPVGKG